MDDSGDDNIDNFCSHNQILMKREIMNLPMFTSQLLLGKNVTREAKDKRNNTVYHYAAITTKDIIAVSQDSVERRSC